MRAVKGPSRCYSCLKVIESMIMSEYINLNTKLRIEAKQSGNNFEVDFFKQMNNSVFGKTLENIRNKIDIRLISTDKAAQKLAAKPSYDCCTIFDENLIAVHMKKTSFTLISLSILV